MQELYEKKYYPTTNNTNWLPVPSSDVYCDKIHDFLWYKKALHILWSVKRRDCKSYLKIDDSKQEITVIMYTNSSPQLGFYMHTECYNHQRYGNVNNEGEDHLRPQRKDGIKSATDIVDYVGLIGSLVIAHVHGWNFRFNNYYCFMFYFIDNSY